MNTTGEPCWIHLFTDDVDTAVSFYGGLFGWSAGEPSEEFGGYRMFLRGDEPVAGLMPNDTSEPDVWEVFLQTPDIAATVEQRPRSGRRDRDRRDAGRRPRLDDHARRPGRCARRRLAAGRASPASRPGRPSARPAGSRRSATSYDDAVAFYEDAFGWDTHVVSDTPEFRYTTLGVDQDARAGIMDGSAFLGERAVAVERLPPGRGHRRDRRRGRGIAGGGRAGRPRTRRTAGSRSCMTRLASRSASWDPNHEAG